MGHEILLGDCRAVLAEMDECGMDAVVTDPPYGLEFMGKGWDHGVPGVDFWVEVVRVLKPGGHLLAFGGTRTYHRLGCAIEDAGFEIRDSLHWLYGSGFPKSLDVSKAVDNAAGAEREVVGKNPHPRGNLNATVALGGSFQKDPDLTAPATPLARQWHGYGTALKPAHEPIILARKPLTGTVAGNVERWGVGGLNVDGCRIAAVGRPLIESRNEDSVNIYGDGLSGSRAIGTTHQGRWPPNLLLDPHAAEEVDRQSGDQTSVIRLPTGKPKYTGSLENSVAMRGSATPDSTMRGHTDTGGASRFFPVFYYPKASRGERDAGVEGRSFHPTVKPINLMRWLVRLVTPPQRGLILDPFAGTGTTGIACLIERVGFVGVELEPDYALIAMERLRHWSDPRLQAEAREGDLYSPLVRHGDNAVEDVDDRQLGLFEEGEG